MAQGDIKVLQENVSGTFDEIPLIISDYIVPAVASGFKINNVPTGAINDINTIFTLAESAIDVIVYLNGARLEKNVEYTHTGNTITLTNAPYTGDSIIIDYTVSETTFSINQSVTGLINGTNTVFTLSQSAGDVIVYLNGIRQLNVTDYTHSGNTITFTNAPLTGDWIVVDYL